MYLKNKPRSRHYCHYANSRREPPGSQSSQSQGVPVGGAAPSEHGWLIRGMCGLLLARLDPSNSLKKGGAGRKKKNEIFLQLFVINTNSRNRANLNGVNKSWQMFPQTERQISLFYQGSCPWASHEVTCWHQPSLEAAAMLGGSVPHGMQSAFSTGPIRTRSGTYLRQKHLWNDGIINKWVWILRKNEAEGSHCCPLVAMSGFVGSLGTRRVLEWETQRPLVDASGRPLVEKETAGEKPIARQRSTRLGLTNTESPPLELAGLFSLRDFLKAEWISSHFFRMIGFYVFFCATFCYCSIYPVMLEHPVGISQFKK